jgi:hypothetical protein
MHLGTKSELAKHWGLDARHSLFKKLRPVSYLQTGGKTKALFAIDKNLTPILVLDFARVERCKTDFSKAILIKRLDDVHGQGWHERIEKLLK